MQQSRSSAEDEYNDRIAQTVQRVQRRTARVATKRRLAVVCALIVSVLAATLATYDALALADQSMRLFAARRTFVALRPGSLLYSALESNRGLIESFRNRCGIEITLPTPIMTQPMPRPTPIERPVVAPDSGIPAQLNCSIGNASDKAAANYRLSSLRRGFKTWCENAAAGCCWRHVDDPAAHKWSAVVDPHDHRVTIAPVG